MHSFPYIIWNRVHRFADSFACPYLTLFSSLSFPFLSFPFLSFAFISYIIWNRVHWFADPWFFLCFFVPVRSFSYYIWNRVNRFADPWFSTMLAFFILYMKLSQSICWSLVFLRTLSYFFGFLLCLHLFFIFYMKSSPSICWSLVFSYACICFSYSIWNRVNRFADPWVFSYACICFSYSIWNRVHRFADPWFFLCFFVPVLSFPYHIWNRIDRFANSLSCIELFPSFGFLTFYHHIHLCVYINEKSSCVCISIFDMYDGIMRICFSSTKEINPIFFRLFFFLFFQIICHSLHMNLSILNFIKID